MKVTNFPEVKFIKTEKGYDSFIVGTFEFDFAESIIKTKDDKYVRAVTFYMEPESPADISVDDHNQFIESIAETLKQSMLKYKK